MLTIATLRLQVPAGFESRAERIGRLLGDALARIDTGAPGAEFTLERRLGWQMEPPQPTARRQVGPRKVDHHLEPAGECRIEIAAQVRRQNAGPSCCSMRASR